MDTCKFATFNLQLVEMLLLLLLLLLLLKLLLTEELFLLVIVFDPMKIFYVQKSQKSQLIYLFLSNMVYLVNWDWGTTFLSNMRSSSTLKSPSLSNP